MNTYSRILRAAVSVAAILFLQTANAVIISGTFTGTAVRVNGNPFTVQEGDAVSGLFSLDTSYPFVLQGGDGSTSAFFEYNGRPTSPDPVPPPPLRVVINAPGAGVTYDIAGDIDEVNMQRDASGQQLGLVTGYGGYCCAGALTLFGAPGTFFSSLDMAALHGGEIDMSRSFASYSDKGTLDFDVAFSSFSFDAAAVPEPQSLTLAGAALAALLMMRRRRAG